MKACRIAFDGALSILTWVTWAFMTGWSAWNVGDGVTTLSFFEGRGLAWNYGFAAALQGFVSIGVLWIPRLLGDSRGFKQCLAGTLLTITVLFGVSAVGYFEAKHSVLYVVKNGMADEVKDNTVIGLNAVNDRVTAIADQVSSRYRSKVTELALLGDDAEAGRDETGVKRCGEICRGYRTRHQKARAEFSDLGNGELATKSIETSNGRTLEANIGDRLSLVAAKVGRLAQFMALDHAESRAPPGSRLMPADLTLQLEEVRTAMQTHKSKFGEKRALSTRTFAILETDEIFDTILAGKMPASEYRWALMYSIAPFGISIVFGMILGFNRRLVKAGRAKQAEQELACEKATESTLQELEKTKLRNWRSWWSIRLFDRGAGFGSAVPTPV